MKSLPIKSRIAIERMGKIYLGTIIEKFPGGRYGTKYEISLDEVSMWYGKYSRIVTMYFHEFKVLEKVSSKS